MDCEGQYSFDELYSNPSVNSEESLADPLCSESVAGLVRLAVMESTDSSSEGSGAFLIFLLRFGAALGLLPLRFSPLCLIEVEELNEMINQCKSQK